MAEYLDILNEAQRAPVLDTEGPVLVLAGAGSGKTRVLTSRIAYLAEQKQVAPWNILAITFTNKAANEMKERISKITNVEGMWVCTIHSMCTRILRAEIERLGYTKNFTIYADAEKQRVIKKLFENANLDDEKLYKRTLWAISDAKARHITPEQMAAYHTELVDADTIAEIYEAYEAEMKRLNSLDFDDILVKTFDLFHDFPEVLAKYQEKFHYIHIDEFQDTNEIQFIIVKALSMGHGNLFAVGDDDQSIYGWRGAEIKNIIDFKETFPNAKIYKLEQNYRSSKKILDAANRIIQNNMVRMNKQLWTENGDGVRIECFAGNDENQEAYYVASQINSLVQYNDYKYSDFGVLMRVNALTRSFEQEFLKYNISYKVFGGFKFYERKEIKDILAYLRVMVNPFDEDAIARVINVPKRGIGEASVRQLSDYARSRSMSLYDAVMSIGDNPVMTSAAVKKIGAFRDVLARLAEGLDYYDLAEFIEFAVKESGIGSMYEGDTEENFNKRLNIEEFINSVQQFSADNADATLVDFLQSVTLSSDIDELGEGDSSVTLATVHAVKGLEFKVVFVVGLDDGIFPLSRAKQSPAELEEERRLMYVAITRARERLYLTRANSRYLYGKRDYTIRSQFLEELDMGEPRRREAYLRGDLYGAGAGPKSAYVPDAASYIKKPQPEEGKDMSRFKIGGRVLHKTFGEGTILEVSGSGLSTMIVVIFKGIGVKTLSAQMAPLTFVEEGKSSWIEPEN